MSEAIEEYIGRLHATEAIKTLFRRYGLIYAWLLMFTNMLAMLATLLAGTIINVAIPEAMGAFGIGQDKAQWLATANLASATTGMLLTAWCIEHLGMRGTLIICMVVFTVGCLVGGFSPNMEIMILGRILQGVPSGIVTPMGMSVIFQVFPAGRQGVAMGVSSIGAILAPALGPTFGGILIDTFNWRYVFFLGVPFSLACIPLALMFAPPRAEGQERHPLDWLGLTLISAAITLLLLGLTDGSQEGWNEDQTLLELFLAFWLFIGFIAWQWRSTRPLLNLELFRYRQFSVMVIAGCVLGAGLFGSTYLLPLFLQVIQKMTPTDSGLAMLPAGIAMALVFPICGRLSDHIAPRIMMSAGIIVFGISFALMTQADVNTSFWTFAWWMIISRIGIALAMPSLNIGAIGAVPGHMVHQASGALNFLRQLGGAFGVNLLAVALEHRHQFHADALIATQRPDNTTTMELLAQLQQQLIAAGLSATEQTVVALGWLGTALHQQAMMLAFRDSFWLTAGVFVATLIPLWLFKMSVPAKQ